MSASVQGQIRDFYDWLDAHFVGIATPRGNVIAEYATVKGVFDRFKAWEREGGLESFHWTPGDPYPYSIPAQVDLLRDAEYVSELTRWPDVRAHRLARRGGRIYVLYSESGTKTIDFSAESAGGLTVTDNAGHSEVVDASRLVVPAKPIFVQPAP
jgi:hypothetical protein